MPSYFPLLLCCWFTKPQRLLGCSFLLLWFRCLRSVSQLIFDGVFWLTLLIVEGLRFLTSSCWSLLSTEFLLILSIRHYCKNSYTNVYSIFFIGALFHWCRELYFIALLLCCFIAILARPTARSCHHALHDSNSTFSYCLLLNVSLQCANALCAMRKPLSVDSRIFNKKKPESTESFPTSQGRLLSWSFKVGVKT